MTEQEKDLLRMIPSMRMEAESMLRLVSHISQAGNGENENEVNKWLDRIHWLDVLEEELKNKEY
jgi:hypothetical protein